MLSSGSGKKGYGILLSSNTTPNIAFVPTSYDVDCAVSGFAYLDVYPLSGASLPTTHDITINSRPTTIVGDYGIIGDNGTIVKVDGNIIVDESTSTVYNPVTNTTNNYTSWAYDYSDRSYNLTLESGDTMTVTYGDEYVTINEGDTTYNVYYLIPSEDPGGSGGSGDTGDTDSSWLKDAWSQMMDKLDEILNALGVRGDPASDCQHTYEDHVDRQPTCAEPGYRTYTCTQCGHTYTEIIDATGHDWVVTNSVPEVVDSEGNVVEKGYDELTCSVCGAQSRDYGDGPEEQDIFDALGDFIADGITWTLEKLTDLADSLRSITDIFNGFVEKAGALAGSFPAFFGAFVALIPEDLQTVIWFAVVAFVVIAVWKKWSE